MERKMLDDVVTCLQDDNVLEAARILRDTSVRHLVVIDLEKKPVGVLSTVDITKRVVAERKSAEETKVSEVMTKPIAIVDVGESYEEAYKKMLEHGTYSIPVTENGVLIGSLDFNRLFCKVKE